MGKTRMFDHVVYFAHGKESGPWGKKITHLAAIARKFGCHVESPDYSFTMDPEKRVKALLSLRPKAKRKLILVGSSMGGYVSAAASSKLKPSGLFLLAPAVGLAGYDRPDPKPHALLTLIIHGWNDELIAPIKSIRYAQKHQVELILVNSDHRLMSALPVIEETFKAFLRRVL